MTKTALTGTVVKFALNPDAEVVGGESYIGDLPPARAALPGQIRRMYLNQTTNNDPVFKVLYEVTEGKYAGFTAWDNVTINDAAAFKWKPLILAMGIDVHELTTATRVNPDDQTEAGLRIVGIGSLDLSGDKGVPVFFGVIYTKYDGVQQTNIAGVKPRKAVTLLTPPVEVPPPSNGSANQNAREKAAATPGAF